MNFWNLVFATTLAVLFAASSFADDMFQNVETVANSDGAGDDIRFSRLSPAALDMQAGDRIHLNFGPGYLAELDRLDHQSLGANVWVGRIEGGGLLDRVIVSELNGIVFGRIATEDGVWNIMPDGAGHRIFQYGDNINREPLGEDGIVPDVHEFVARHAAEPNAAGISAPAVETGSNGTVDLMVLYSTSMVTTWGAGVSSRVIYLVSLFDQALIDSDTGLRARLVYLGYINASETASSFQTLYDLREGASYGIPSAHQSGAGQDFSGLLAIRDAVGADLVGIIRRHYTNSGRIPRLGSGCGTGFIIGSNDNSIDLADEQQGVAAISDFVDGNAPDPDNAYTCSDMIVAHEFGHNLGFDHNLANVSTNGGVTDYALGYRVDCKFFTIMGYPSTGNCPGSGQNENEIPLFSNPDIALCLNFPGIPTFVPCGSTDEQEPADNARAAREESLNVVYFRGETPPMNSAVLPSSRTVQNGQPASAFAMVINPQSSGSTAEGCGLRLAGSDASTFSYQTTNAQNGPVGTPNTPVDIGAGDQQSFVFTVTSQTDFGDDAGQVVPTGNVETDLFIEAYCNNRRSAEYRLGLNTLSFRSTADAPTDIIALAATPAANPGYVHVPVTGNQVGVFSVAIANVGVAGTVTVTADTGNRVLDVERIEICNTDPATGVCLTPRQASQTLDVTADGTATFGIFVRGNGNAIANDPAGNRVFVRFAVGDMPVGATSVAVRTP